MILLDTNTVIFYLKGHKSVVSHLQRSSPRDVAIPSIVAYEIEYGTLKIGSARRRTVVSQFLSEVALVPFDYEAARESARIRRELETLGLTIGPLDVLIAGTALSCGAVLVTHNLREFSRVKGLRLADWSV